MSDIRTAIIAITRGGAILGLNLHKKIASSELYISKRYADLSGGCAQPFEPTDLKKLIATLWKKFDGFIMIMATGIVVRIIAPLLESKKTDPAVVVIDDTGKFAISLLSGHLGGANELAERCAFLTGGTPVITTATDANNLPSFDLLAKEKGWIIDEICKVKKLNGLLLDNKEIAVVDESQEVRGWLNGRGLVTFYNSFSEALSSRAEGFLFVTNQQIPLENCPKNLLILRPRNLTLGIGCNRGTSADEIEEFVRTHLGQISLSPKSVRCIATVAAKSDEAGLIEFAKCLDVPLHCFESYELNKINFPSPPSKYALSAVGVAAVAEPAAIIASGGGELLLNKVKSANVTLAVAKNIS